MIELFQWSKDFNRGDINKVFIVKEQVKTRTNSVKLDKFKLRKEIGEHCFTNRVVKECNKLSKHVVSAKTVKNKMFKEKV